MSEPVVVIEPFLSTGLCTVAIEPNYDTFPPRMGFGDHTEAHRYAIELAQTYGLPLINYVR